MVRKSFRSARRAKKSKKSKGSKGAKGSKGSKGPKKSKKSGSAARDQRGEGFKADVKIPRLSWSGKSMLTRLRRGCRRDLVVGVGAKGSQREPKGAKGIKGIKGIKEVAGVYWRARGGTDGPGDPSHGAGGQRTTQPFGVTKGLKLVRTCFTFLNGVGDPLFRDELVSGKNSGERTRTSDPRLMNPLL